MGVILVPFGTPSSYKSIVRGSDPVLLAWPTNHRQNPHRSTAYTCISVSFPCVTGRVDSAARLVQRLAVPDTCPYIIPFEKAKTGA